MVRQIRMGGAGAKISSFALLVTLLLGAILLAGCTTSHHVPKIDHKSYNPNLTLLWPGLEPGVRTGPSVWARGSNPKTQTVRYVLKGAERGGYMETARLYVQFPQDPPFPVRLAVTDDARELRILRSGGDTRRRRAPKTELDKLLDQSPQPVQRWSTAVMAVDLDYLARRKNSGFIVTLSDGRTIRSVAVSPTAIRGLLDPPSIW